MPAAVVAHTSDDDFGLDSDDEAELLQLPVDGANGLKRKSDDNFSAPAKRPHLDSTNVSQQALDVANSVLQQQFGMQSFRLKQAAVIGTLLDGGSAVVVFPTGGGKSLCYQVPALCFKEMDRLRGAHQGGITLVVSPLIALMKDQVDALKRRGISAAAMDSSQTNEQYMDTVGKLRSGTLDILYVAPERLNNEGFVASIANASGGVRLLAVDEAHCVSEWGHAFRPDYLKVARFAKEVQAERVVCLTATATPKVADGVREAFEIPQQNIFRTTTYRSNLRLLAKTFKTKKDSLPELVKFLKQHPGPTIIYVTLQRHTEELAGQLKTRGFNARHFHASVDKTLKMETQDHFMQGKCDIIVATIAFGMGIDKADIRNVIHYDIPRSLEGYSQEIGRAGRDGKLSHCLLYLCAEDDHLRESFCRGDLPSKISVAALLHEVFSTRAQDGTLEVALFQQASAHDIKQTVLKNIYAQLELRFGLLRETTPKYTKYTYKSLRATTSDTSRLAEAIRKNSNKAQTLYHMDVDQAAKGSGHSRMEVVAKLNGWHDHRFIDLRTSGVMNVYRVMKPLPKTIQERNQIIDELYSELQARENQDLDRMEDMTTLITRSSCLSRKLANHFGDTLPDNKQECGHCSWCETHKPIQIIRPPKVEFDQNRFRKVLAKIPERDDARFLARVAFGIGSPRVTTAKLGKDQVFGSMEDHDFMDLLAAFEKECAGR